MLLFGRLADACAFSIACTSAEALDEQTVMNDKEIREFLFNSKDLVPPEIMLILNKHVVCCRAREKAKGNDGLVAGAG